MDTLELERCSNGFALWVIRVGVGLPKTKGSDVLGDHLLKAGTSVGAHDRAANRAESRADFIHKISLGEKEASDSQSRLERFEEIGHGGMTERRALLKGSGELLAIFTAIGKSPKAKNAKAEIGHPK